jgi:hypothetical protein
MVHVDMSERDAPDGGAHRLSGSEDGGRRAGKAGVHQRQAVVLADKVAIDRKERSAPAQLCQTIAV